MDKNLVDLFLYHKEKQTEIGEKLMTEMEKEGIKEIDTPAGGFIQLRERGGYLTVYKKKKKQ
jgi:hypothetical protein